MRLTALLLLSILLGACASPRSRPEAVAVAAPEFPRKVIEAYRQSRAPGDGVIEQQWLLDARAAADRLPTADLAQPEFVHGKAAAAGWSKLGPYSSGGRTRHLEFLPDGDLLAGAVAGGIWRGGTIPPLGWIWTTTGTALLPNVANGAFTVSRFNPDFVLAGSGEPFGQYDGIRGVGIFRSGDGGTTFDPTPRFPPDSIGRSIRDLTWSVTSQSTAYAATTDGIWRTTDFGVSWHRFNPAAFSGDCYDLEMRTGGGPDHLLAACWRSGAGGGGVIYLNEAANGAGTWTATYGPVAAIGRMALAAGINNSARVYAVAVRNVADDSMNGGLDRLLVSSDGGSTWTVRRQVAVDPSTASVVLDDLLLSDAAGTLCNGYAPRNQGWYDLAISVDPVNDDIVFIGAIDLFRSNDAGQTWGMATRWWSANSDSAHADIHALAFAPGYDGSSNQTLWFASDGGVWRTSNARGALATRNGGDPRGATAVCNSTGVSAAAFNTLYGVLQYYHGDVDYYETRIVGGTQDNGTWSAPLAANGAGTWAQILGADGGPTYVHPTDPLQIVASIQNGSVFRTSDGGSNWNQVVFGSDCPIFISPVARDPNNANRFYATDGVRLLQNLNGGSGAWTPLGSAIPGASCAAAGERITTIEVMPGYPNYVAFGTSSGRYCYLTDALVAAGAHTLNCVSAGTGWLGTIAFDAAESAYDWDERRVYVGFLHFNANRFRSASTLSHNFITHGAESELPAAPVLDIEIEPNRIAVRDGAGRGQYERIYLATEIGLFAVTRTNAGNFDVSAEANGLPKTRIDRIVRPRATSPYLYAFTHGLGAWRARVLPNYRKTCSSTAAIPDYNAAGVSIDLTLPQGGEVEDIDVQVNAVHPYVGDLKLDLVHVGSGRRVNLIDRPSQSGSCRGDNISVLFDDAASLDANASCQDATPALSGTLRPSQGYPTTYSLSSLHAVPATPATWRLEARDLAPGDTGSISFCVAIATGLLEDGFE